LVKVRRVLVRIPAVTHRGSIFAEFTDAIGEDWGGKPFVDMEKGWKFALDAYPEVLSISQNLYLSADARIRSILSVPLLLVLAGVAMRSSMRFLVYHRPLVDMVTEIAGFKGTRNMASTSRYVYVMCQICCYSYILTGPCWP
jgi:hypothetical protein